jgi:hypothetical protein
MGDRANVLVKDGKSKVYLYTHWAGTELPATLQTALKRQWRWDDGYYLCRIIFCQMVKGHEDDETGFGISSIVGDGADRIVTVDVPKQRVEWAGNSLPFEQFIALPSVHWDQLVTA